MTLTYDIMVFNLRMLPYRSKLNGSGLGKLTAMLYFVNDRIFKSLLEPVLYVET